VPLILSGLAIVRNRRRRLVQFWVLFTVTFFVLALGPYLHIAGNIVKIGNLIIPLPYLLLYKIVPFIGISRSLSRFGLMVMIGLGVLSAVSLTQYRPRLQLSLLALIIVEFIAIPYPMSKVDTPMFFKTIAAEPDTYNIAYLPMNWDRPVPLLYQTVHHKGLLTAYTSRNNPLDLSWRTPVLQEWRTLNEDIIKTDLATVAPTILHDFNIKYVVLDYYQMPPGPERDGTEKWVTAALPDATPVYQDDRLKVYQAPPVTKRPPYLQLGDGWGALVTEENRPTRTVETSATVKLVAGTENPTQLFIATIQPYTLAGLAAFANDTPLPITLSANGTTASVTLPQAATIIRITVPQAIPISRLQIPLSS